MDRRLDGELQESVSGLLDAHLAICPGCARHARFLDVPRRLARIMPAPEPSPFFSQRVMASIGSEVQGLSIWQVTVGLARYFVPALAAVTLALLSAFTYQQVVPSPEEMYQAYDTIFTAPDRSQRMIIADPADITDERVLDAIAEGPSSRPADPGGAVK